MSVRHLLPPLVLGLLFARPVAAQTPEPRPVQVPQVPAGKAPAAVAPSAGVSEPVAGTIFDGAASESERSEQESGWISAGYVFAWLRGSQSVPIVTSAPVGTPIGTAGVIGATNNAILLGHENWNTGTHSGLRFSAGSWFEGSSLGFDVGGFVLERRAQLFNVFSNGQPGSFPIARPFVDVLATTESASYTAFPGEAAGSIAAAMGTRLWGLDTNLLYRDRPGRFFQTTFLTGLRYLNLDEDLNIQENTTPLGANAIPFNGQFAVTNPDRVRITDAFRTHNSFFGAQVGFRSTMEYGPFDIMLGAKLALGATHQNLEVLGRSEAIAAATNQTVSTARGGFLANNGNIGSYSRDAFTAVPELESKVAYRINSNLSAFVSYNFLYWSDVLNPTEHVNRSINLTQVPTSGVFDPTAGRTPASSIFLNPSSFWASSIQLGFCLKF